MDCGGDGSRGEWVGGSGGLVTHWWERMGDTGEATTKGEAGARGSRWEADDELTERACVRVRLPEISVGPGGKAVRDAV
jgi:hypothetical protein